MNHWYRKKLEKDSPENYAYAELKANPKGYKLMMTFI